MTRSLIVRAVAFVPRPVARWLTRVRRSSRLVGAVLDSFASWTRAGIVEIRDGPGQGLLIDCRGGKLSFALGTAEPDVQRLFADRLAHGDVLYDVGANVGFFTLVGARLVGPEGLVVSFEPSPSHAVTLRENVRRNGFENVVVIEKAAFSSSGTGRLAPGPDPTGARLASADADGMDVELTTIDGLVEGGGVRPPTLVKLDVEGAEIDVIHGMIRTLQSARPAVICELHSTRDRFVTALESVDYDVRIMEESVEDDNYHALATPRARQEGASTSSS